MRATFLKNRSSFQKLKKLVQIGGVAAALAVPVTARADNLTDAMIGAYNSSGLLEQNRALLRVTDESVATALAALRPVVNWTVQVAHQFNRTPNVFGGISENETNSASTNLNLSWVVWDGGQRQFTRLAAEQAVLATRQSLLNIEQQVLFQAVQAYVGVLTQQENVRLRESNLRLLREELRAANNRFEVKDVTRTDVALAQSRVAGAQAALTQARGDLEVAKATYKEIVGRAPGPIQGQPPLPKGRTNLSAAQSFAMRNHPIILGQQFAVKAAELTTRGSKAALGPTVTLNGNIGFTDTRGTSRTSSTSGAALVLSQNLYAGGGLASAKRADVARLDAEKGALITAQRGVASGVAGSFAGLEAATASLVSSNEQVRAARLAFEGLREEATLGARTTLDVLEAEQDFLDAQVIRIQARANQALAAYSLLQAQGLLTAENLGLAVEIYDPTLYYNLIKDAPAERSKRGQDLERVLKALGKN
ncbi:outer membrane protein [Epibacterium ulvae]|uniref:Outer membrane protein n=1 Tax=Epibacterium ulvae TaxID=1156985 RepID=A0A1G5PVU0_9RHOB|nr:TolC family outer membrane protein [Epibacterium ulvae]SCZ53346.1 outer membrane protein [Epibacterium ulvae]